MKVAVYCQHVLGIGHFHRTLALCRQLAQEHELMLILGGPEVNLGVENFSCLRLPGLEMDNDFKNLQPCDTARELEQTKTERKTLLFDFFKSWKPEIFIPELYPFGRKAFRFELDPILKGVKSKILSPCLIVSSVRDILVDRGDGQDKFEKRVVKTLNSYFDGLLIHSDKELIPLSATFKRFNEIKIPHAYTGFISRTADTLSAEDNSALQKLQNKKLIVASIGGGGVGEELLSAIVKSFLEYPLPTDYHLHIFTGLYSSKGLYNKLNSNSCENLSVSPFSKSFQAWLKHADLSISMAGYNSCMDILKAGTPALMYPFEQNQEQRYRVMKLSNLAPLLLMEKEDLEPLRFHTKILAALKLTKSKCKVSLDGSYNSHKQISIWYNQAT